MFNKHFLLKMLPRRFRPQIATVKMQFFDTFGYELNLNNPETFNEKINWIKCYDRNPLITQCSDKYAVRDYVTDKVGTHILNELYGVYETANEIDFSTLPNRCVLKVTHGSGFNIFVKDGKFFIKKKQLRSAQHAKIRLKKWMKKKQHIRYQEWCYKNISPRIVCERYLENTTDDLIDYKIHCFGGEPHFIQVVTGRKRECFEAFYDLQWNMQPFHAANLLTENTFSTPACMSDMLNIASALSAPFSYVRVDLYVHTGRPFFGEMSFYPLGGYGKFNPHKWDKIFGDPLILPNDKLENQKR